MSVEPLHALPIRHGAQGDAVLAIALVSFGVLASALAGLLVAWVVQRDPRWAHLAPGFCAGALLFLFFDLLKEAASLGQSLVARPFLQAGLVTAFLLGLLLIPAGLQPKRAPRLVWLWTAGVAGHTLGEGWVVGTEASSVDLTSLPQTLSFLLHKMVEAFTIPIVAGAVLGWRRSVGVALLLSGAVLVAAVVGYWQGPGLPALAAFAFGAGAAAWAVLLLARQGRLGLLQGVAAAVGLVFVYLAGLLHEL